MHAAGGRSHRSYSEGVQKVMSKLSVLFAVAATLVAVPASSAPVGPDAERCAAGPALVVGVTGLKTRRGMVRVQLYGANPAEFLAKGKKMRRIDVPVTGASMDVCLALPGPGKYAVAVRHDADANRKSGWNDGGGFSRNPAIKLTSLKPRHSQVAITVGPGVHRVPVVMQYRQGLSVGPVRKGKA